MNGTGSVGLPWVSILGFIRIATHPKALDNPLDMGGACTRIGGLSSNGTGMYAKGCRPGAATPPQVQRSGPVARAVPRL